ncbi:hypothetical protein [Nocardia sp. NPDC006630]|uniref:hypothetical protein n=1 Tax=Nocardia sp. NPDC006630 TaxID=3157181 RepID=UPI0033B05B40
MTTEENPEPTVVAAEERVQDIEASEAAAAESAENTRESASSGEAPGLGTVAESAVGKRDSSRDRKGSAAGPEGVVRAASGRVRGIRIRLGGRVRLPVVMAAVSAVVVVAAGLGFGAWHFADARGELRHTAAADAAQSADRDAALKVGGDFLATAYTVDAVNDKGMAKWNAAMTAATTDTLKEQVRQTKALLSLLAESNASMSGAVSDAAVISQNDTLIRVLAVVKLTGRAPGQNDPTTGSVTEYIDLMKVGGQWKVFGYKDIGAKSGPGQPDAGLPGLPAIQPAAPAK